MGPSGPRTIKVRPDAYNPDYFQKFASGYADQDKQYREADALKEIYQQYQDQGMGLEQKFQTLQTDPRVSPSRRAEVAGQLKAEAEIVQKNQAAAIKAQKQTQASQPINPQQLKAIQDVEATEDFKNSDNAEKQRLLRNANVSKENIDSLMKPYIEQGKVDQEREKTLANKQATEDVKFVSEQLGKYPSLVAREQTIKSARQLNEKGITGQPWDQAMQKAGLLQYTSEGYREFASYAKEMVKNANIKGIIGSQISALEFNFFRDATISERFSKEANEQILKKEELALRYDKLYSDITQKILQENEGQIPEGMQSRVTKEFSEQSQKISNELKEVATDFNAIQSVPKGHVLMYDKKRRPLHVPENEVEKYSKPPYGATLS